MNNNILKKYTFWSNIDNQLLDNFDFSQTSISELADKSKQDDYLNHRHNSYLHDYIFKFYAYNELLSSYRTKNNGIIDNEDLKIYSDYQDFANDFSKRIFSFILYSCLTECKYSHVIKTEEQHKKNHFNYKLIEAYIEEEISNIDYSVKFLDVENIDYEEVEESQDKNKIFKSFIKYNIKDKGSEFIEKMNSDNILFKETFLNFAKKHYRNGDFVLEDFRNKFSKTYKYIDTRKEEAYNNFSKNNSDIIKNKEKFENFIGFLENIEELSSHVNYYDKAGSISRQLVADNEIQNSLIKDFTVEEMFEYISKFFLFNFNEGYGNKPWSDIAKHALSFAKGEINAEIFIDQALSMEHNNGNMFNKNYIFEKETPTEYVRISHKDSFKNLDSTRFELSINDFLLHLQNSSSVLSCSHLINKEWSNLNKKINSNDLKKEYSNYDESSEAALLKNFDLNFEILKGLITNIKSMQPMLDIAKKIDYSIPKFDWGSICSLISDKRELYLFEDNPNPNTIFSDILNLPVLNIQENIDNSIVKKPFFKLHNLNSSNAKTLTKEVIGGKAYGLTNLINKGFNVPKALVFDTKTCLSYIEDKEYFNEQYKDIDQQISDYLIDDKKEPLLVSVRSGAPVSMPGMMDSILNVGIDDTTYKNLCKTYGKDVINDCSISFMTQFCNSKLGLNVELPKKINKALDKFAEILIKNDIHCNRRNLFPLSKEQQIKLSVEAVFDSWNSPRAIAWRNEKSIDHNMGTAATVQQMVFGNKNDKSLTCVIFSRDCITGKTDIMGEYLPQAQGEDLVAGKRTPLPISELKITNPKVYQEIEFIAKTLEEEQKAIQDLEITVEDGKVFVLQMRNAVVSPEAQLALAKEMNLNLLDVIQPKSLIGNSSVNTQEECNFKGLAASPGLIAGIIVRNQEDIDKYKSYGKDLIFFSNQALPEHAPIMIATQGFVTEIGGATSHAAILARSMGKPCVVGIGKQESDSLESGSLVTIDASEGKIWKGELDIVVSQEQAINLANQLISENKINLDLCVPNKFTIHSWITDLSVVKVIPKKETKHKMFLNIAQQVALALQKNHQQELRCKM